MHISYSEEKNGKAAFRVELTHDDIANEKKEVIKKFQEKLDIKGFRKGKVPEDIVIKQVGEITIAEEAVEKKLPEVIEQGAKENDVDLYGQPNIKLEKLAPSEPIVLSISFTRVPRVTLKTYTGLGLSAKEAVIDEQQRERSIKELQQMRASERKVLRAAKKGDKAVISFNAFMDNVPLEGGKAEKHPLMLGENTFIPGFEDAVLGMQTGEEKSFTLEFPKEYHKKDLQGKPAEFKVKLEDLFEIELPELNDDFAKSVGAFKTMDELKKQLDDNLKKDAEHKEQERFEIELMKTLIAKNEFEAIPDEMISDEQDRMVHELEHAVERDGAKFDDYLSSIKKTREDIKKEFARRAEERIKSALLLRKIAEEKKLFAKDEEIDQRIHAEKQLYKENKEAAEYVSSPNYRRQIAHTLTSQHVLAYLKKENTIKK